MDEAAQQLLEAAMSKADKETLARLELLDLWRKKQPGKPSRLEALKRIEMPPKAIEQILNAEGATARVRHRPTPKRIKTPQR